MESYDVVIIGAGLGGLQSARLLGRLGMRVLLADCKRSLDAGVHTTGIFVRRTLEDFVLPEDCLGPVVRNVVLYSPRRRPLQLESPRDEFRVGRMGRLYLRYLDECIAAGVRWSGATRYWGFEQEGESLIIHLESGGLIRSVKARYLIGADGARSSVARDLKLDSNREWIVGVEDVFSDVPLEGAPCFHCFLDSELAPGYIAWVVHDGLETHVGVGGYPKLFEPVAALETFRASLKGIVDLSRARRLERRGGRIPVGGVLPRIVNSRGLLVGDAAGAVSPLTAGGLDPCMRLSKLAAEVTFNYLSTGVESALEPYSGARFRARFVSRLWMRRTVSGLRQPQLLEAACAVLRLPVFRSLAWQVFFGHGSFPDTESEPFAPLLSSKVAASRVS